MPITFQDIEKHRKMYGIQETDAMSIVEYRQALADGAIFWIDHHDFIRSTLSGEIIVTNREQLNALINYLEECRVLLD
ncbi:hypothetical protein [Citrobacter braakii]|uniref:hypothetical protein n=1 Tax=Citrobacter braakii TaxID=57706 RepID=UPI00242C5040|nr:hypothetical protein [Citrobacter braakii]WFZ50219.1 hypothetical protein NFK67_09530 [Citrobacter braakii]